jgi:hypothetical protein
MKILEQDFQIIALTAILVSLPYGMTCQTYRSTINGGILL